MIATEGSEERGIFLPGLGQKPNQVGESPGQTLYLLGVSERCHFHDYFHLVEIKHHYGRTLPPRLQQRQSRRSFSNSAGLLQRFSSRRSLLRKSSSGRSLLYSEYFPAGFSSRGGLLPQQKSPPVKVFSRRSLLQDEGDYLLKLVAGSVGGGAAIKYGSILFPDMTRPNLVQALLMISLPVLVASIILLKETYSSQK
ncbi:hypothetical protein KSP39_PZI018055 [Platanthera zijinensis]|uniref:Uncharacterized protein n=1 Tax=Platanthera zijinensis TaxID=2320716 RepID=A0AAP0B4U5_9ASPA